MQEDSKLKFISCSCKEPLRVIYIEEKPYVHPEDLEHMQMCPFDDPKYLKEIERQTEEIENYY